jgi:dimethylhistidine N-methyltransferase
MSVDREAQRAAAASPPAGLAARFADDVRFYLSLQPKQLPSRYLYDALGSALFNAICELPWYTLTRAESRLLDAQGREILELAGPIRHLAELGSGDGRKLARLLAARPQSSLRPDVHLIDISASALAEATRTISAFDGIRVVAHHATYEDGLERAAKATDDGGRTLALFLGSNIGNFDPPSADALLTHVRHCLRRGDLLLIGADLIKPEPEMRLAYDDPLGVTAAFNLNLLARMNRELDANFDLSAFAHVAAWNAGDSRMEMHLRSRRTQQVAIRGADLDIALHADELIWTESSYKYDAAGLRAMIERAGFQTRTQWIDPRDQFALTLAEAV